jgi:CRISPR-associated protein Csm4
MSDGFPHVSATPLLPKPIFTFLTSTAETESEEEDDNEASRRKKAFKNLSFLMAEDIGEFVRKGPKTIFFQDYENLDFMESVSIPLVAVSRGEEEPSPFQANYIRFKEKCGLWVLFEMEDESRLTQLKQVVGLLGDDIGIGGEKSTGAGRFSPEWSEINISQNNLAQRLLTSVTDNMSFDMSQSSDAYLLLSLANPNGSGDIAIVQDPQSLYRLTYRRGFHYSESDGWPSSVKKRPVSMLMAGSLLSQKIFGRLVDVTPDLKGDQSAPHPLYRYGFALCAGV